MEGLDEAHSFSPTGSMDTAHRCDVLAHTLIVISLGMMQLDGSVTQSWQTHAFRAIHEFGIVKYSLHTAGENVERAGRVG